MYLEIGGNKLFVDYDQLNTMLTTGDPSLKGGEVSESETEETFNAKGELIGKKVTTKKSIKAREVDGFRYQMLMEMLGTVMDIDGESDSLGNISTDNFSVGQRIAYNTLIEYKVLNIIE